VRGVRLIICKNLSHAWKLRAREKLGDAEALSDPVNNPHSAMGPADEDNLVGSVAEPNAQSEVADAVSSRFSGPVGFGENFSKKVRKHIDQIRNRGSTREAIPSPAKGGVERVRRIIQDRVAREGGRATTFAGEAAVAFEDGGVTYIFSATGEFWTILGN
jgi:hypothetical protein